MGLSVAQQAERNREIVDARLRRVSWGTIAKTWGLSERRCQQIFEEWKDENPSLRTSSEMEIVEWLLDGYTGIIEELALVSQMATQDAVKVGAINAKMNAIRQKAELLQAIGALPNDLGELKVKIDVQYTIERVISVLKDFDAPVEMLEAMESALGGGPPALEARNN